MPSESRLHDHRTTTLDANGFGSVNFGPSRPNTKYIITGVGVQVSSNTLVPTAKVYRGTAQPSNFISGTYDGSSDADNALNEELWPGEIITVTWESGDVGATATANFRGQEITGV